MGRVLQVVQIQNQQVDLYCQEQKPVCLKTLLQNPYLSGNRLQLAIPS